MEIKEIAKKTLAYKWMYVGGIVLCAVASVIFMICYEEGAYAALLFCVLMGIMFFVLRDYEKVPRVIIVQQDEYLVFMKEDQRVALGDILEVKEKQDVAASKGLFAQYSFGKLFITTMEKEYVFNYVSDVKNVQQEIKTLIEIYKKNSGDNTAADNIQKAVENIFVQYAMGDTVAIGKLGEIGRDTVEIMSGNAFYTAGDDEKAEIKLPQDLEKIPEVAYLFADLVSKSFEHGLIMQTVKRSNPTLATIIADMSEADFSMEMFQMGYRMKEKRNFSTNDGKSLVAFCFERDASLPVDAFGGF